MPEPRERAPVPGDAASDPEGMVDLDTFERMRAAEEASRPAPPPADPDALPSIDEARRRELKAQARQMIEERLRARRKQRRLMRGGNV